MVRRKMTPAENPEVAAVVSELARRREIASDAVAYVRLLHENLVDQPMVLRCLELGLSQAETAARLGMSKREVNRLANTEELASPTVPPGRESPAGLQAEFLAYVWGPLKPSQ